MTEKKIIRKKLKMNLTLKLNNNIYLIDKKGGFKKMRRRYFLLVLVLVLSMFLVGCGGGGTSEPIPKPDQSLQVEREKLLDELDNIHMGFKLPRSSGIDAVVGAAWYDLPYEVKEKYASVAAAWALCKYYEEQDFYVVRFRDWRTDKEVATLSLSATRGTSFKVK